MMDKVRGKSAQAPNASASFATQNSCLENSAVNLNDKSLKVIYNASAYKEEKDDKVRAFLRFIQTNEPGYFPCMDAGVKQEQNFGLSEILSSEQNRKFCERRNSGGITPL